MVERLLRVAVTLSLVGYAYAYALHSGRALTISAVTCLGISAIAREVNEW